MKKFLLTALLVVSTGFYLVHAENAKDKDKEKAKTAKVDDKQGYKDGDKGTMSGEITKIDKNRVTVKDGEKQLTFMPVWKGGAPKDGGGFDKDILEKIGKLKVGAKVKVSWHCEEHLRIDSIDKSE